ncbi:GntR family transcriptional regulator [Marimonas arenosa]|uniref:GntR family transcriptional regulator n=1 Tax=Marimonas arenosa TaxID=1795305 RepID=A0AAE3WDS8_9RHOB|nr:GntR family transcriptional regulator [Marimonas arenosa]MDQ2091136.1 GntR family transcriptional regulator [Marimonas arenosa]
MAARQDRRSWRDVLEEIRNRVLTGRYGPGDKLPRDEDIAAELGCARSTVQRAMRDLADRGVVERRRKGGTRVRPDPVTRAVFDIPVARNEVESRGGSYGYQLIRAAIEETPPPVAAALDMRAPLPMLHVEALHLMNSRPFLYEDRWVLTRTVPEIETVDLGVVSANEWLLANKPYSRCDLRFSAETAGDRVAAIMGLEGGEALFVIERTTWSGDDPITTVKAVYAPGYHLRAEI